MSRRFALVKGSVKNKSSISYFALGIALGTSLGVATHQLAFGIGLGVVFGAMLGAAANRRRGS